MKPLLPFNSPTYLRRLARELNALTDGFYYQGQRWNRARVSSMAGEGGARCTLQISRPSADGRPNSKESTGFASAENLVFSDAYGRSVYASRR